MGIALDNEALSLNKKEIMEIQSIKSTNFNRAYNFLASAKSIHEDWSRLNSKSFNSK